MTQTIQTIGQILRIPGSRKRKRWQQKNSPVMMMVTGGLANHSLAPIRRTTGAGPNPMWLRCQLGHRNHVGGLKRIQKMMAKSRSEEGPRRLKQLMEKTRKTKRKEKIRKRKGKRKMKMKRSESTM